MSDFVIRPAEPRDLPALLALYAAAREFMAAHGNPRQWAANGWPPEAVLREDTVSGRGWVCVTGRRVCGAFVFVTGVNAEPGYAKIEDGAWRDPSAYGVIHRLASDRSVPGIGTACLDWAWRRFPHLRADTHPDNVPMQRLLEKCGFVRCGTVHVEQDDDPRIAYEKTEKAGR